MTRTLWLSLFASLSLSVAGCDDTSDPVTDRDGDGIEDAEDADDDNDGVPDAEDDDDNGDGEPDTEEETEDPAP